MALRLGLGPAAPLAGQALYNQMVESANKIKASKIKDSTQRFQYNTLKKTRELLATKLRAPGAFTDAYYRQTENTLLDSTDILRSELYKMSHEHIAKLINDSNDSLLKTDIASRHATIAWIDPTPMGAQGLNPLNQTRTRIQDPNFAYLPANFRFQVTMREQLPQAAAAAVGLGGAPAHDGLDADRTDYVLNILTALMKSNTLAYEHVGVNGEYPQNARDNSQAPFEPNNEANFANKILPEHVGLEKDPQRVHNAVPAAGGAGPAPHTLNKYSKDIILLNNAFHSPAINAVGGVPPVLEVNYNAIQHANPADKYNFNGFLLTQISNDNHYYRNNVLIQQLLDGGARAANMAHYVNKILHPFATLTAAPVVRGGAADPLDKLEIRFAKRIYDEISKDKYLNTPEFKDNLSHIITTARNIINGSANDDGVVNNICAMVACILAASHTDADAVHVAAIANRDYRRIAPAIPPVPPAPLIAAQGTTAIRAGRNAIMLTAGNVADGADINETVGNIETDLNTGAFNIRKAGAQFLRIIGMNDGAAVGGFAGTAANVANLSKLAIQYIALMTIEASKAAARSAAGNAIPGSATSTGQVIANVMSGAIKTVISGAIPANLGTGDVGGGPVALGNGPNTLNVIDTGAGAGADSMAVLGIVDDAGDWNLAKAQEFDAAVVTANAARGAGITTILFDIGGGNPNAGALTATNYASMIRIYVDPHIGFLKDVIRKIKLPLYMVDLAGTGKITTLNIDGVAGGGNTNNTHLEHYLKYMLSMENELPAAFKVGGLAPGVIAPPNMATLTNDNITGVAGAFAVPATNAAIQKILRKVAYYPKAFFTHAPDAGGVAIVPANSYDLTNPNSKIDIVNREAIRGAVRANGIAPPQDTDLFNSWHIHKSILNDPLFMGIVSSPEGSTFIQVVQELEQVTRDLAITKMSRNAYKSSVNSIRRAIQYTYNIGLTENVRPFINATGKVLPFVGGNKKIRGGAENSNPMSKLQELITEFSNVNEFTKNKNLRAILIKISEYDNYYQKVAEAANSDELKALKIQDVKVQEYFDAISTKMATNIVKQNKNKNMTQTPTNTSPNSNSLQSVGSAAKSATQALQQLRESGVNVGSATESANAGLAYAVKAQQNPNNPSVITNANNAIQNSIKTLKILIKIIHHTNNSQINESNKNSIIEVLKKIGISIENSTTNIVKNLKNALQKQTQTGSMSGGSKKRSSKSSKKEKSKKDKKGKSKKGKSSKK